MFSVSDSRRTYFVILSGAIAWCSAIVLAPLLTALGGSGTAPGRLLYAFFQPICHQLDSRSLHLFGFAFGVCIRCSAIYFAFLGGVLLYPFFRRIDAATLPPRHWLFLAALPMIIDVVIDAVGLHEVTALTRSLSGGLLGVVLPFYILPSVTEAIAGLRRSPAPSHQRERTPK